MVSHARSLTKCSIQLLASKFETTMWPVNRTNAINICKSNIKLKAYAFKWNYFIENMVEKTTSITKIGYQLISQTSLQCVNDTAHSRVSVSRVELDVQSARFCTNFFTVMVQKEHIVINASTTWINVCGIFKLFANRKVFGLVQQHSIIDLVSLKHKAVIGREQANWWGTIRLLALQPFVLGNKFGLPSLWNDVTNVITTVFAMVANE